MLKLDPRGREASPRVHGKRPGKDVNKHIPAYVVCIRASLVAQLLMNPPAMQRPAFDPSIRKIPWRRERQPVFLLGEFHGQRNQYSCLENPTDRGTWQAIVHGVTKSQTGLND